jgi:tryptophan synthase beta subunit
MFVPETLMDALNTLAAEYATAREDKAFQAELADSLKDFAGRPTPLYLAERLTRELGGGYQSAAFAGSSGAPSAGAAAAMPGK